MKVSLKALRVNADMTQDDAAEAIGVTKKTIQNWETYATSPTAIQLLRLCLVYHCDLGDIFLPDKLAES